MADRRGALGVERRVDGFRAVAPGGLRSGYAGAATVLGVLLFLQLASYLLVIRSQNPDPLGLDALLSNVAMVLIGCNVLALLVPLWRMRVPGLEVVVELPRLTVRTGRRTQGATIVGGAVSRGPATIDVDPVQGGPLRIPTEGLNEEEVERLVGLLRQLALREGGSEREVPAALRAVER